MAVSVLWLSQGTRANQRVEDRGKTSWRSSSGIRRLSGTGTGKGLTQSNPVICSRACRRRLSPPAAPLSSLASLGPAGAGVCGGFGRPRTRRYHDTTSDLRCCTLPFTHARIDNLTGRRLRPQHPRLHACLRRQRQRQRRRRRGLRHVNERRLRTIASFPGRYCNTGRQARAEIAHCARYKTPAT